ncbi:hypothetical protein [Rhodoblastus sp.]
MKRPPAHPGRAGAKTEVLTGVRRMAQMEKEANVNELMLAHISA